MGNQPAKPLLLDSTQAQRLGMSSSGGVGSSRGGGGTALVERPVERFGAHWRSAATPRKVVLLGLDGAGKSTVLSRITRGEEESGTQDRTQDRGGTTGGFNFAEFSFLGSVYQFGDFSGKASLRSDWKHHVSFNNAIIFVVDSSAPQRLPEARQALAKVLREGQGLEDSFLLVVANKQDVSNCLSKGEVETQLALHELPIPCLVVSSKRRNTQELMQGLEWLDSQIREKYNAIEERRSMDWGKGAPSGADYHYQSSPWGGRAPSPCSSMGGDFTESEYDGDNCWSRFKESVVRCVRVVCNRKKKRRYQTTAHGFDDL